MRTHKAVRQIAEGLTKLKDLSEELGRWTYDDIRERYGWSESRHQEYVRLLRGNLASEGRTITCVPQGQRRRWLYMLTNETHEVRQWYAGRLLATETALQTILHVASSMEEATDPRSMEGRVWRTIKRHLGRLCEDMTAIKEESQPLRAANGQIPFPPFDNGARRPSS